MKEQTEVTTKSTLSLTAQVWLGPTSWLACLLGPWWIRLLPSFPQELEPQSEEWRLPTAGTANMVVLEEGLLLWGWARFFYIGPESNYSRQSLLYPLPLLLKQNNTELMGFPGGSAVKHPPANARALGSIPGSERFPRGGNGSPLVLLPEESHTEELAGCSPQGCRVGHGWARNGYGCVAITLYSQKGGANIGPLKPVCYWVPGPPSKPWQSARPWSFLTQPPWHR